MKYEEIEINSERWFNTTLLLNEEFRNISGYENEYQVSNYGRIKSLERIDSTKHIVKEKIIKYRLTRTGYCRVGMKSKDFYVHRLVANAFIENTNNFPQINHIDGNKTNNRVNNIEWCTAKQNLDHSVKIGLRKYGKDNPLYGRKLEKEHADKCRKVLEKLHILNQKKINQYDIEGNFIRQWNSVKEASMSLGIKNGSLISRCALNGKGIAYGYKWKY